VEVSTMNSRTQSLGSFVPPARKVRPGLPWPTMVAGGFYLAMGGIHVGIVAADAETYRPFADDALFGFVRTGWVEIFMANPTTWGLLLAGRRGPPRGAAPPGRHTRAGRLGRDHHVPDPADALRLGVLVWSLPALVLLYLGVRRDWALLEDTTPDGPVVRPGSGGSR
jgi:hypothetical protein